MNTELNTHNNTRLIEVDVAKAFYTAVLLPILEIIILCRTRLNTDHRYT